MQFKIKRDVFLESIQKTLGIVERNAVTPILNNILIRTGKDRITIIATDREIGVTSHYDAEIISDGEITLSARKLFEMIREIDGKEISFKKNENNQVNLICRKIVCNIPGIPVDDFPVFPDDDDLIFRKVRNVHIKEMIDKTFFAMSKDDMRSNLNGVFLQSEKNDLQPVTPAEGHIMRMVATDANRLSLVTLKGDGSEFPNVDDGIILPRKGVGEIRKLVDDGSDYTEIGVKGGICVLRKDNTVLRVSLIDSIYPDYKKVVPADSGIQVTLGKDQILHSLRLMSVVSSEKNWGVKIKIMEGSMALNLTNADIGEANEEIDISYSGEEIEAAYNVNYLIDAIQVIKGKNVSFEMREGLRPCVISEVGNDSYISVIMPLKI